MFHLTVSQIFIGAPTPQDWARVLYYAHRIKDLTCPDYSEAPLTVAEGSVLSFLSIYRPSVLFPNIQHLYCRGIELLEHIHIFLGPKLKTLSLVNIPLDNRCSRAVGRLFTSLLCMSLSIRQIKIYGTCWPWTDGYRVHLKKTSNSDDDEWPAMPPSLSSLDLRSNSENYTPQISLALPSLFDLMCTMNHSITLFSSFMELVTSTSIRRIEVSLFTLPPASHLQEAFRTLSNNPCHTSVTELEVNEWFEAHCIPKKLLLSEYTITGGTFGPLLELKNLRVVRIRLSCYYALDDSFIRDIALSWPHLLFVRYHGRIIHPDHRRRPHSPCSAHY